MLYLYVPLHVYYYGSILHVQFENHFISTSRYKDIGMFSQRDTLLFLASINVINIRISTICSSVDVHVHTLISKR